VSEIKEVQEITSVIENLDQEALNRLSITDLKIVLDETEETFKKLFNKVHENENLIPAEANLEYKKCEAMRSAIEEVYYKKIKALGIPGKYI